MNRTTLRLTFILGLISIAGIIIFQTYFIQKSLNITQKQLNQSIQIALHNVAEKLSDYNNATLPYDNVVYQYSPSYYIVNVNNTIDATVLEHFLIKEFKRANLKLDFEYAIYDCFTDKMVYGRFVKISAKECKCDFADELFKYDQFLYYFGIHFPGRKQYIISDMKVWYFLSAILLIVILFFGYTQLVILKQKKLTEIQKSFIDNVTHEFKTPISSINLSAEVLSEKGIERDKKRMSTYISIIKNQAIFIKNQIDSILESINNNSHSYKLNIEIINAHEFMNTLLEVFKSKFCETNCNINIDFKAKNPIINTDKTLFSNLLFNILDNAVKFSPNHLEIHLCTENIKNKFIITVKDKGIGIHKQHLKKIFKRFFRVQTGNVHDVKGFGLGLSYVKQVVKLLKWKISVKSELEKGTKFIISIPQKDKNAG